MTTAHAFDAVDLETNGVAPASPAPTPEPQEQSIISRKFTSNLQRPPRPSAIWSGFLLYSMSRLSPRASSSSSTPRIDPLEVASNGRIRMATAATAATRHENINHHPSRPILEEVLLGRRGNPFTLREFREFLHHRRAEESLDFLAAVIALHYIIDAHEVVNAKKDIIETFVRVGSPREVNVSFQARQMALSPPTSSSSSCHVFSTMFVEVWQLLDMDLFQVWVMEASTMNLSACEARFRAFFALLSVSLAALVVALSVAYETPWASFAVIAPWYIAASSFFSWQNRICETTIVAAMCCQSADGYAMEEIRHLADVQTRLTVFSCIVMSTASIVMVFGLTTPLF